MMAMAVLLSDYGHWVPVFQIMVRIVSLSDDGQGCQSVRLWQWLSVCQMMAMVVCVSDYVYGCQSVR